MISSKKQLRFYIKADHMMNRGAFNRSIKKIFSELFFPDYIMTFLRCLRKDEYYRNIKNNSLWSKINYYHLYRLGIKLDFSIASGVLGYGCVIPHYGTIVIGTGNMIGNYAVLHTSACITSDGSKIGNAFYLSTGAKVVHGVNLGDNISVGANSLVNCSYPESNCLLAGMPAKMMKDSMPWYMRDGKEYERRVSECEKLKRFMNIDQ